MLRRAWSAVQGDPSVMQRLNGWATVLWIVMIPVAVTTGLIDSVPFVSAISLWALVSGHLSAWQAARTEATVAATSTSEEVTS